MLHKLATGENFDIQRGNQTVRVPFDATDPASAVTKTLAITDDIPDVSNLAAKAPRPTADNLAALDAQGNPVDSGKKSSDFATAAQGAKADDALSRAEAEEGFSKWVFSPATFEDQVCSTQFEDGVWYLYFDGSITEYTDSSPETATRLSFINASITATRTRIPKMADLDAKLGSTSAAPAFDATATYDVGKHVTYNGQLYRCTTAVTTAGAWNAANWTAEDMTTPDATLDVTAAKQLRVVAVDGTVIWAQGYDLATTSSATISNEALNKYDFTVNATDAVSLTLPTPLSGKVGDFVLDVANPALDDTATGWATAFSTEATYAVDAVVSYDNKQWRCTVAVETAGEWTGSTNWVEALPYFDLSGLGTIFNVVVPVNENLTDMLTFAPGDMAELYFTQTAFTVGGLPAWKIVRQDVETV